MAKPRGGPGLHFNSSRRDGRETNVSQPHAIAHSSGISDGRLRAIWLSAGIACLIFAWYGSLVPLAFSPRSFSEAWQRFTSTPVNWQNESKVDWGVNALLLVPAGFCLLGAATSPRAGFAERIVRTMEVAVVCLLASFLIEFSQNWFPPRVPSLGDVVAQFLGAAVGLAGWWLCGKPFNGALADFLSDKHTRSRLDLLLVVYLVGYVLACLMPLDLTLHPSELVRKYRHGQIQFAPFSHPTGSTGVLLHDAASVILLSIPVGMFAASFPARQNGKLRSKANSLILGGLIVLGIEVLQLLVMSRYTDTTDVITGCLGVAVGALGFHFFSGQTAETAVRPTRWQPGLLILAALHLLLVTAIFWAPFDFTASDGSSIRNRMSHFVGVPFASALSGDYASALSSGLQKFALFVPLGCGISLLTSTIRPNLRFVANVFLLCLTAAFALALELGQILLPSRFASFDDVVICVCGSLVGFLAINQARKHS
jgi:glycopeptide antibiotics resistance protein